MKLRTRIFGSIPLGIALVLLFSPVFGQGIIVNELSNGPSGSQEYFEFVVVGPPANPNCGPIDLRGWIFDDNNGDFSCGACAGTGIATGHMRFAILPVWSAVPTGSIIVIYDPGVKNPKIPADDPTDTSPADGVYILPNSHSSLQSSTTPCASGNLPTGFGACGSCTGNISYAGACYTSGLASTNAGLRNTGDAAQTRLPNGTYFHGLAYGNSGSNMSGGPDGLFISGDGSGMFYAFTNSVSNNFQDVLNFGGATVASNGESPGLANSVNNAAWIASLKTVCLLPVNYAQTLQVTQDGPRNVLHWTTATEMNSAHFDVERSNDLALGFEPIGSVGAAGYSQDFQSYAFTDATPRQGRNWYRLKQVDRNGEFQFTEIVEATNLFADAPVLEAWPNPANEILHIRAAGQGIQDLVLRDALGRVVHDFSVATDADFLEFNFPLNALPQGNYFLQMRIGGKNTTQKILVLHD